MKSYAIAIFITLLLFLGPPPAASQDVPPDFTAQYNTVVRRVGRQPLLVILLMTSDPNRQPSWTQVAIRNKIFGSIHSVASYFLENSYGQFTFTEAFTTPWLTALDDPNTDDWDESTPKFIYAGGYDIERRKSGYVIQQVARQTSFKFSDWDANRDGVVDESELAILWIYPEAEGGREREISPYPLPVTGLSGGVRLPYLARVADGDSTLVALMAHELAHEALHLSDLYADEKTGYPGNSIYSLMSDHFGACQTSGSTNCYAVPHLDPWAKIKLGWLSPTVVTGDGWYSLPAVETTPQAVIVYRPYTLGPEYFILENRWPAGSVEDGLPDRGLAIWHITQQALSFEPDWGRNAINLERARGMDPADSWSALWDSSDPATGYAFSPNSSPANSNWQDGSPSGIMIRCMPAAGPVMNVYIDLPPLQDTAGVASQPAPVNSPDGALLDLFSLSDSGAIAQMVYTRGDPVGMGSWTPLPGGVRFTAPPAAINSPDGSLLDVFALGEDGVLYEMAYARGAGGWQDWSVLPGGMRFVSAPAAINSPDGGLLDVFALGADGNLYEIVYTRGGGGWGSWVPLPGGIRFISAPAAINSPDGSLLDVFALGADGNLYELVYARGGGGWGSWMALAGNIGFTSAPAVITSPDGTVLDVFALGADGAIHQIVYERYTGRWGAWTTLPGGSFASAPAAVNSPDGSLVDVFALGTDGFLYEIVYVRGGGGWGQWQRISTPQAAC